MSKIKCGTLNTNKIQLNQRKFITSEISRGTGIIKPAKGKGSYKRKAKHRKSTKDYLSSLKDSPYYILALNTTNQYTSNAVN